MKLLKKLVYLKVPFDVLTGKFVGKSEASTIDVRLAKVPKSVARFSFPKESSIAEVLVGWCDFRVIGKYVFAKHPVEDWYACVNPESYVAWRAEGCDLSKLKLVLTWVSGVLQLSRVPEGTDVHFEAYEDYATGTRLVDMKSKRISSYYWYGEADAWSGWVFNSKSCKLQRMWKVAIAKRFDKSEEVSAWLSNVKRGSQSSSLVHDVISEEVFASKLEDLPSRLKEARDSYLFFTWDELVLANERGLVSESSRWLLGDWVLSVENKLSLQHKIHVKLLPRSGYPRETVVLDVRIELDAKGYANLYVTPPKFIGVNLGFDDKVVVSSKSGQVLTASLLSLLRAKTLGILLKRVDEPVVCDEAVLPYQLHC